MPLAQDVALPRVLDDTAFAYILTLIACNNADIILSLYKDEEVCVRPRARGYAAIVRSSLSAPQMLATLFHLLRDPATDPSIRRDAAAFLETFCSLARNVLQDQRHDVYLTLYGHGLLEILPILLSRCGRWAPSARARAVRH